MTRSRSLPCRVRANSLSALLAAGLCALSLSACKIDDGSSDPVAATDYHLRYPVALTNAPATLDIFEPDGVLDKPSLANIRAFVDRYRDRGAGRFVILAPSNNRHSGLVAAVRRALAAEGVTGPIVMGSYPTPDPSTANPVRLMFQTIIAKVRAQCGEFPTDLASGDDYNEWKNLPYENYGCPTQKMLAAQIDDPRDLARARALTEPDVAMRLRAIDDVRKGQDPGTLWQVKNTAIGSVGGY